MGKLTQDIVEHIKSLLEDADKYKNDDFSLDIEHYYALEYIQYLIKNINELTDLEAMLVRLFRIRPVGYNEIKSPVSSVYSFLTQLRCISIKPQTNEEDLLSKFLKTLFSHKKLGRIECDFKVKGGNNYHRFYDTVANIKPDIHLLFALMGSGSKLLEKYCLHNAVKNKDFELSRLLLAMGVDVNLIDQSGVTALDLALKQCCHDIIIELMRAPEININESILEKLVLVFSLAIENNNHDFVNTILSIKFDEKTRFVNQRLQANETLLMKAVEVGNFTIVKNLLENGADANHHDFTGRTPLSIIPFLYKTNSNADYLLITKILLDKMIPYGINHERGDKCTALKLAMHYGLKDMVSLLIENACVKLEFFDNVKGNALLEAVKNKWDDIVLKIISKNDELINMIDHGGCSPLYYAVQIGSVSIVKILLDHGANADGQTSLRKMPFYILLNRDNSFSKMNDLAIAKMLLEKMKPSNVNQMLAEFIETGDEDYLLLLVNYQGINLDRLFSGKRIETIAKDKNWTHVTKALQEKKGQIVLDQIQMKRINDTIEKLTDIVNKQSQALERLNEKLDKLQQTNTQKVEPSSVLRFW